jgi:hypothetical protein
MKQIELAILGKKFIGFCDNDGPKILPDPFLQSRLMEVSRVGLNSKYIPVVLAQAEHGGNYFLFFASNVNEQIIQWNFTKNLVLKSQEVLSAEEFSCFLSIYKFQLSCWYSDSTDDNFDGIRKKIDSQRISTSLKLPTKAIDQFKCIEDLQGRWSDLKLFEKNYKSNYFELCTEIQNLINKNICTPEIFIFFKRFLTKGLAEKFIFVDDCGGVIIKPGTQEFIARLINSWKFICLREIFYLLNGKHLCYSPFSGRWVLSEKTICSISGTRFSLFNDSDVEFLEFSGYGFINPVNGYLVPALNNELITIDSRSSPASWCGAQWLGGKGIGKEIINAAVNKIRSAPFDSFNDERFILNNNTDLNLGHMLWNDLSGIFYCNKICKELSLKEPTIAIFKNNLTPQRAFSSLSYSQITADMANELGELPLMVFDGDHDDEFIKSGSFVFLKSLFMSNDLIDFYNNFFIKIESPDHLTVKADKKFIVFINVRSHDKSLLNLKACFNALITSIGNAGLNTIEFLLEGDSSAEELMRDLRGISINNGFECEILLKLNPYELYSALHRADFVVAPVGSGLVLPTWVLNKACITYAEPQHLSQLLWWNSIVDKKLKIDSFSNEEIAPVTEKMYASYTIDPNIFAEKVLKSISKNYH